MFATQLLHGLNFATFKLAISLFVKKEIPKQIIGFGQGFLEVLQSASYGLGSGIWTNVYENYGGSVMYLIGCGMLVILTLLITVENDITSQTKYEKSHQKTS